MTLEMGGLDGSAPACYGSHHTLARQKKLNKRNLKKRINRTPLPVKSRP
jgi:hypothetical protein